MSLKPDSQYPCYGHDCYDRGNYHRSCPSCDFFKCVKSENERSAAEMTDAEWYRHIIDVKNQEKDVHIEHRHNVYTLNREVRRNQINPNSGIRYENLDDVLRDHIAQFGKIPIDTKHHLPDDILEPVELKDTMGFVVDFTDDTVDIELTSLGEQYLQRGLLDKATIQFNLITRRNEVLRVICARPVFHGKKIEVVFDCDNVLLLLNNTVFSQLWLPLPKGFDHAATGQYKPDELLAIKKLYCDPEIFKLTKFAEGADKIKDLEQYNAHVSICTRSYTPEVEDVKRVRLPDHTGVALEDIDFQLSFGEEKNLPEKADIIVEDCIESLLRLPNNKVKVLIDKSHNQRDFQFDFYNKIWRMPDLKQAIQFVEYLLKTGLIYDKSWINFNPNEGPYSMICR